MLNFDNLSDVDFEYLCKDILSKELKVKLHIYARGRDKGIDIADDVNNPMVLAQVKHYPRTSASTLVSNLKKELEKVKELNPNQYYIMTSCPLSPANVKDIYTMFSDYMESENNIYALSDIDSFLKDPTNEDILQKHLKLYLDHSGILKKLGNTSIFIDSEDLIYDIQERSKFFVETNAYEEIINKLNDKNFVFVLGNPGMGKTFTSKMVVMRYAADGYLVRYSSNSSDLKSVKNAISLNPDVKEIILIDDCLGQAYFQMKENQSDELLSLIRYIARKSNQNKKLIINSRITVFNEAKQINFDWDKFANEPNFPKNEVIINELPKFDKARILYNHIKYSNIEQEYTSAICTDKQYWRIINHRNFNPRIIETIIRKSVVDTFSDPKDYLTDIYDKLDNPRIIWENEYNNRLNQVDRIFMTTLFSLSEYSVDSKTLEQAFYKRLKNHKDVDFTKNNFELCIKRLNESLIRQIYTNGKTLISVANPSINDFLKNHLENNYPENSEIIDTALTVDQVFRVLNLDEFERYIQQQLIEGSIENYTFPNINLKATFVVYYTSKFNIRNEMFQKYYELFVSNPKSLRLNNRTQQTIGDIIKSAFSDNNISYYKLDSVLSTEDQLDDFLDNLLEDDLNEAILTLDRCFNQNHPIKEYFAKTANTHIKEDINTIIDNAYIFDYYIDLEEIVESSMDDDGNADLVYVENVIRDYILEELKSHLESTYENPYIKIDEILDIIHEHAFDEFGIEDEIEGYLNSKFKERSSYESERHTDQEIDVLFDSLIG